MGWFETPFLELMEAKPSREACCAEDHCLASGEPFGLADNPVGRDAPSLRQAPVMADAEVVTMRDDGLALTKAIVGRTRDLAGHVNPGDQRRASCDLALGNRGETVLVVERRPFDPDPHVTIGEVGLRHLAHGRLDAGIVVGDEGAERVVVCLAHWSSS